MDALKLLLAGVGVWQTLRQAYWWQIKEYRWDRWWSWVKYNGGWKDLLKLDVRWPEWTVRGMLVAATGVVAAVAGGWYGPVTGILGTAVGVVWTYPVMEWQRIQIMARAKQLVEKYHPKVVTVNGSYGKSSSKDFVVQLLSQKFRVVATTGSENSELGVARRILRDLKKDTQILVLEMGAYKRGEIARMCRMVRPDIALVTGIGPQHVDLFGGLENSQRAEFETIEALLSGGAAIINGDSSDVEPLIEWAKKGPMKTVVYSVKGKLRKITADGFELNKMWMPIRGAHFAQNVMGALMVARELGIRDSDISLLKQPPKSYVVHKLKSGAVVIDNSYNTNKEGFIASVDYLKLYSGRKFVVTPGIIELGKITQQIHEELGQKMKDLDGVIVSRPGVEEALKRGGAKIIRNYQFGDGDTVLIEGRIAPALKKRILEP